MTSAHKASFWYRLLASYLDFVLLTTLHMLFLNYAATQPTLPSAVSALVLYVLFFVVNPVMLLQSAILTYYFGGSLGKLLVGLTVTDEHGKRLLFKRVFFRQTIGYQFAALLFGLGYFSILKDPNRQGWHDKAVGSLVLVKRPLWIIGIILSIILTTAIVTLFINSIRAITTGPLQNEAQQLFIRTMMKMQLEKMQKIPQAEDATI